MEGKERTSLQEQPKETAKLRAGRGSLVQVCFNDSHQKNSPLKEQINFSFLRGTVGKGEL